MSLVPPFARPDRVDPTRVVLVTPTSSDERPGSRSVATPASSGPRCAISSVLDLWSVREGFQLRTFATQNMIPSGFAGKDLLYDIKGGLRPPAGCARLASLAVLAGQHQERDVAREGRPATTGRPPTSTAGIEGGGVARRATRALRGRRSDVCLSERQVRACPILACQDGPQFASTESNLDLNRRQGETERPTGASTARRPQSFQKRFHTAVGHGPARVAQRTQKARRSGPFVVWARRVSNLRPLACEASALPLSYAPSGDEQV